MALFRDDQGKTEKPTPGRIDELRKRGETPLSRELTTAGSLLVAAIILRWTGGWLGDSLSNAMRHGLNVDLASHAAGSGTIHGAVREILGVLSFVAAPVLLLMMVFVVAVLIFGYGQIGIRYSSEAVGIKFEKLNPVSNMKRVFNMQAIVRAAFAAVKLGILGIVLWLVLRTRWSDLLVLSDQSMGTAVGVVVDLAFTVLLWVAVIVMLLAIIDVSYQRFDFQNRNMMSKREVDDERKRSEGDPLMRSRLRQARTELLKHRMMEAVPKADVIITNPTHFSVALRYDRKRNAAPELIAKGMDDVAMRIRELAREHDIPMLEDPPLARALFRAVKVGQEIPARFYEAAATVLSHIYRLKDRVA